VLSFGSTSMPSAFFETFALVGTSVLFGANCARTSTCSRSLSLLESGSSWAWPSGDSKVKEFLAIHWKSFAQSEKLSSRLWLNYFISRGTVTFLQKRRRFSRRKISLNFTYLAIWTKHQYVVCASCMQQWASWRDQRKLICTRNGQDFPAHFV